MPDDSTDRTVPLLGRLGRRRLLQLLGAIGLAAVGLAGIRRGVEATSGTCAGRWASGPGPRGAFDRFTPRARNVLDLAQDEGRRLRHDYLGTEHLLLGLIREERGLAARVLRHEMGVDLPTVRSAVEAIVGRGTATPPGELRLTPRAKRVLELARDEAKRLRHDYVGTEHLLLGVMREGEGVGAAVLASRGIALPRLRSEVLLVLGDDR